MKRPPVAAALVALVGCGSPASPPPPSPPSSVAVAPPPAADAGAPTSWMWIRGEIGGVDLEAALVTACATTDVNGRVVVRLMSDDGADELALLRGGTIDRAPGMATGGIAFSAPRVSAHATSGSMTVTWNADGRFAASFAYAFDDGGDAEGGFDLVVGGCGDR